MPHCWTSTDCDGFCTKDWTCHEQHITTWEWARLAPDQWMIAKWLENGTTRILISEFVNHNGIGWVRIGLVLGFTSMNLWKSKRHAWRLWKAVKILPAKLCCKSLGLRNGIIQKHSQTTPFEARGVARARQIRFLVNLGCSSLINSKPPVQDEDA